MRVCSSKRARAHKHTQGTAALPVLRCKNKFAFVAEEIKGGYRDLMLSVLYEEPVCGLRIIGEIQAHARTQKYARAHAEYTRKDTSFYVLPLLHQERLRERELEWEGGRRIVGVGE